MDGNFVQCFAVKDKDGEPFYTCGTNVFQSKQSKRNRLMVFTATLPDDRDPFVRQVVIEYSVLVSSYFTELDAFKNTTNAVAACLRSMDDRVAVHVNPCSFVKPKSPKWLQGVITAINTYTIVCCKVNPSNITVSDLRSLSRCCLLKETSSGCKQVSK